MRLNMRYGTSVVLRVVFLGSVLASGRAMAQDAAPGQDGYPKSPLVRELLRQSPAGGVDNTRSTRIAFARRLIEVADGVYARGERGYGEGWAGAASRLFQLGEHAEAGPVLTRLAAHGETLDQRTYGACMSMQWYQSPAQRVEQGPVFLAIYDGVDPARLPQHDFVWGVRMYAEALSNLGRFGEAIEVRRSARARVMSFDVRTDWASLDVADANDYAALSDEAGALRSFDDAFARGPAMANKAVAPMQALTLCQKLHPTLGADPAYERSLLAMWARPELRRHPRSVCLAAQAAATMRGGERQAEFVRLADEVLAAVPAWREAWTADRARRDRESAAIGVYLDSLVDRARAQGLGAIADQLAAEWELLKRV